MTRSKTLLAALLFSTAVQANSESWYVQLSCDGEIEVQLPDRTRIDCLTDEYAIEYDFTSKWAEAIGQSLHYSLMTGKQAGIILIGSQEDAGYKRALEVIKAYNLPITLNTLPKNLTKDLI